MPDIDNAEITRRFTYYPPRDDEDRKAHESLRFEYLLTADTLADALPEGREKSLAVTALEESLMWANAALARARAPK